MSFFKRASRESKGSSRREFVRSAGLGGLALALGGCGGRRIRPLDEPPIADGGPDSCTPTVSTSEVTHESQRLALSTSSELRISGTYDSRYGDYSIRATAFYDNGGELLPWQRDTVEVSITDLRSETEVFRGEIPGPHDASIEFAENLTMNSNWVKIAGSLEESSRASVTVTDFNRIEATPSEVLETSTCEDESRTITSAFSVSFSRGVPEDWMSRNSELDMGQFGQGSIAFADARTLEVGFGEYLGFGAVSPGGTVGGLGDVYFGSVHITVLQVYFDESNNLRAYVRITDGEGVPLDTIANGVVSPGPNAGYLIGNQSTLRVIDSEGVEYAILLKPVVVEDGFSVSYEIARVNFTVKDGESLAVGGATYLASVNPDRELAKIESIGFSVE